MVWAGDFNYRVDAHYDQAKEAVRRGDLQALLAKARSFPPPTPLAGSILLSPVSPGTCTLVEFQHMLAGWRQRSWLVHRRTPAGPQLRRRQ